MSELTSSNLKVDHRPPRSGWADGNYLCKCARCEQGFIGEKRSWLCADCAYLDKPIASYSDVVDAIKQLPMSQVPGVIIAAVETAIQKQCFKAGRISHFVGNIEAQTTHPAPPTPVARLDTDL